MFDFVRNITPQSECASNGSPQSECVRNGSLRLECASSSSPRLESASHDIVQLESARNDAQSESQKPLTAKPRRAVSFSQPIPIFEQIVEALVPSPNRHHSIFGMSGKSFPFSWNKENEDKKPPDHALISEMSDKPLLPNLNRRPIDFGINSKSFPSSSAKENKDTKPSEPTSISEMTDKLLLSSNRCPSILGMSGKSFPTPANKENKDEKSKRHSIFTTSSKTMSSKASVFSSKKDNLFVTKMCGGLGKASKSFEMFY
jgi:hypothetical protein